MARSYRQKTINSHRDLSFARLWNQAFSGGEDGRFSMALPETRIEACSSPLPGAVIAITRE
jgi:hypothetical protein